MFKLCGKFLWYDSASMKWKAKLWNQQWTDDRLQAGNEVICNLLSSTMTQFYCQEMNNVAKSFKHIKWKLLYTTPKKWTSKEKTLYEGKFNTVLMGVLAEFQKYNFWHRKMAHAEPLIWKMPYNDYFGERKGTSVRI
jgi:hypothetical protein